MAKLKTVFIILINTTTHTICNFNNAVPKEILVVSHNRSNYDYHFIIKDLLLEFEGEFNFLGQNI